jgi:ABC-type multidrug transport system fused ATPase/permease subunit
MCFPSFLCPALQEVAYFDQTAVGDLTSRLGNDCQAVAKVLGINVNVMLRNALQVRR